MKQFAIGDIHGAYEALLQVIEFSKIDKDNDMLIVLGDVVDGWNQVKECVEELLTFKNLIIIRGNHDQWFMDYVNTGEAERVWTSQGGEATIKSYKDDIDLMKFHMYKYFYNSVIYYVDTKNRLYVHGGFNWKIPIEENNINDIMWDRHAYQTALQWERYALQHPTESGLYFKSYNKVFVGHTTTQYPVGWYQESGTLPIFAANLVNLDTGAGWDGKLTIMDVDTEEYWQSSLVQDLYPDVANIRK